MLWWDEAYGAFTASGCNKHPLFASVDAIPSHSMGGRRGSPLRRSRLHHQSPLCRWWPYLSLAAEVVLLVWDGLGIFGDCSTRSKKEGIGKERGVASALALSTSATARVNRLCWLTPGDSTSLLHVRQCLPASITTSAKEGCWRAGELIGPIDQLVGWWIVIVLHLTCIKSLFVS